ncbi:hypothetical protein KUTeg_019747 [Tegillarca granosa]|uniref:Alpha/beta hydrolase fold-3 domain-containing protein n=1 Tax=Tegillarca granosa TaxID=220873 RepID=A0ABQ9EDC1_TEGGR|nr:hypothetical protein KUTeg_019747 [Tegillarca granosa]
MAQTKRLLNTVLLILIAYRAYIVVNRPVPTEFTEPMKVRVLDEIGRIANFWMDLSVYFEFNPAPDLVKLIVNFIFKLMLEGLSRPDYNVEIHDDYISGVPVRVFIPKAKTKSVGLPAMIYLHGGGWTWFNVYTYSGYLENLANRTNCIIVAVEYRKAPEHQFPIAYEECISVTWKILLGKSGYPIHKEKVMVAGDGAGGGLAAAIAKRFQKRVLMQILINPSLQFLDFKTPSYRDNVDTIPGITSAKSEAIHWLMYCGVKHQYTPYLVENEHTLPVVKASKYFSFIDSKKHIPLHLSVTNKSSIQTPYFNSTVGHSVQKLITNDTLSPILMDNLQGIPNAYIITSQYDVVRDEGIMFASRLHESKVRVKLKHYTDGFHGFFLFSAGGPFYLKLADKALSDLEQFIHVKVHGGH